MNRECISEQINKVVKYYAKKFTNKDMKVANVQLEKKRFDNQRRDIAMTSYFAGAISIIVIVIAVLIGLPSLDEEDHSY